METSDPLFLPAQASSKAEMFVQSVEEMSPAIPLVVCLMWGMVLILLSFTFHLATFSVNGRAVGWMSEPNWSLTFGGLIPLSLFFSCSALNSIPQVITALSDGKMIRNAEGDLCDTADLLKNWRWRAGKAARIAVLTGAIGLVVSWSMVWTNCVHPRPKSVISWQRAIVDGAPEVSEAGLVVFGILAYTSQGAAIACFCYYILIIFTFANWVHDYTKFGRRSALYPDIRQFDTRYGFERFGPVIENILFASIAYFFQFFMTRLFYIYADDSQAKSISSIVSQTIGDDFGRGISALVHFRNGSLFEFGSLIHLQNTVMVYAMIVVVISAIVVPMVIVRNAADRSRVRLQEAIQEDASAAQRWYGIDEAEAQRRLDKMTIWPIRYAKPVELLLLIILATACFFAYKLLLFLAAFILFQGVRFFSVLWKSRQAS